MKRRILLSTPLRNEASNIPKLYKAVADQDRMIDMWVIVENGSTDGSRELLRKMPKPANVAELVILNEDTESGEYALGQKYARIVNRGFEEIRARSPLMPEDLIGILDADSFPEPDYYTKLSAAFESEDSLGIASGISRDEDGGAKSIHSSDWVRGSCRLWRGKCMINSGYVIGPSADTLSLARAELDGWLAKVVPDAVFVAREVGTRSKQGYYGASAYYRGNTLFYSLLRFAKFSVRGRFGDGAAYFLGYLKAYAARRERVADLEVLDYFQGYVWRKFKRVFG